MRRRQEAAEFSEIGRETAMYFASATLAAKTFETREEDQKLNPPEPPGSPPRRRRDGDGPSTGIASRPHGLNIEKSGGRAGGAGDLPALRVRPSSRLLRSSRPGFDSLITCLVLHDPSASFRLVTISDFRATEQHVPWRMRRLRLPGPCRRDPIGALPRAGAGKEAQCELGEYPIDGRDPPPSAAALSP